MTMACGSIPSCCSCAKAHGSASKPVPKTLFNVFTRAARKIGSKYVGIVGRGELGVRSNIGGSSGIDDESIE